MDKVVEAMGDYIHLSKYAKWLNDEGRRELSWDESVNRLEQWWIDKFPDLEDEITEAFDGVHEKDVMPSMRTLMTAGPALDRDNMCGFNCAGIAVNHPTVFPEIFHTLMNGTGVGFSVERQYINKLPTLPEELHESDTVIKVRDSKAGWAKGVKELLALLYGGDIPRWDLSSVRPAGARLKTFGGRASGPEPLDSLFHYTVSVFKRAVADGKEKLNSLECHDLVCKIADTVIVGSVRRSACISLSNLTDTRMAHAKRGAWFDTNPERALSNNSVAYTEKPDLSAFMKEMRNLYQSKAGERGIINKQALKNKAESTGREYDGDYVLNPCGEAILRDSGGLCNLTEVVVRSTDTFADLTSKARKAAIIGTLQSSLTDFKFVRKVWRKNQEEERLLGVGLTGIMDHPVLSGRNKENQQLVEWLKQLKEVVRETNKEIAEKLGIPKSTQLTLIKPSGTVSQLVQCSSGIHPRYAPYYFRRVTQDVKDPLTNLMKEEGIPYVVRGEKVIFSFPIKAPDNAVVARDMGAIEQLELWKVYREHYCEGNPSQTIYYTDKDFLAVQQWVYDNWDIIGGLSFFPLDDMIYDREIQPYLEVTEDEYLAALEEFPEKVDWDRLPEFEVEDNRDNSREFTCSGDKCEI